MATRRGGAGHQLSGYDILDGLGRLTWISTRCFRALDKGGPWMNATQVIPTWGHLGVVVGVGEDQKITGGLLASSHRSP
jgi:hypothetical protein